MDHSGNINISEYLDYVAPGTWKSPEMPRWPPDVFALGAALLQQSGAYTRLVGEWQRRRGRTWCKHIAKIGKTWRNNSIARTPLPKDVTKAWEIVLSADAVTIDSIGNHKKLYEALFELVAAADEACQGVGIPPLEDDFEEVALDLLEDNHTLCKLIGPSRLRVLPKLHTPQSGMTIRSMTHNLALCRASEVKPEWHVFPKNVYSEKLNLLVLPWPTVVDADQFTPVGNCGLGSMPKQMQFFSYEPRFQGDFRTHLRKTIESAQQLVEKIDGVIFPELSLTNETHEIARDEVLKRAAFLISGVHDDPAPSLEYSRNYVAVDVPIGSHYTSFTQQKHHRWRLNRDQVLQYELESSLDANCFWWENTDMSDRKLVFISMRPWLTICVLICEDLARQDPVSDIVRAVGPNLVVALLMDGPQLLHRWAAKYATVLADDPGSSVLTVTSLGMAQRSIDIRNPGAPRSRDIALWKDGVKGAKSIPLPENAAGIILSLQVESREEFSADGRGDSQKTRYPVLERPPIPVLVPISD
jgi:hypothetical protein